MDILVRLIRWLAHANLVIQREGVGVLWILLDLLHASPNGTIKVVAESL
jgi:hypothetical protein